MKFEQWYEKNEGSIYNDPIGAMEQAFNAGQQQYKSLVKTVDADNLPYETDVIGIDANMQFILSDGIWIDCLGSVSAGYELGKMTGITHYIEQKDLIKMIGGVTATQEIKTEESKHICQGCGGTGFSGGCDHCIPY